MRQKEADELAQLLMNFEEIYMTKGYDNAMVVASEGLYLLDRIKEKFPMISDSMNELEIIRAEE